MTDSSSTSDTRCENCGAPLPPADSTGMQVCAFCKMSRKVDTSDDPVEPDAPRITVTIDSDSVRSSTNAKKPFGCLIFVIIIIALGASLIPLFTTFGANSIFRDAMDKVGLPTGSDISDIGSIITLPGEPSSPLDIVAVTSSGGSSGGKSNLNVTRFDATNSTPTWKSEKFAGSSTSVPIVANSDTAVVGNGSELLAFAISDGRKLWSRALSDDVRTPCNTCLTISDNQVVATSRDGTLAAFDLASGTPSWNRRLEDTNARVFVANSMIGVIDGTGGESSVLILDPADGAVVDQFTPVCMHDGNPVPGGISNDSQILTTPGDPGIYLGFGILPACWQRWDPTTHSVTWNVTLDKGYLDSGAYGFISGGTLWFTTRDRATLGGINLQSGSFTALPTLPDTDSVPIALHGQTLILRGVSTRGTDRYLLWGLDVASGAQPWQYLLDKAEPADPPDAETIFVSDGSERFTTHLEGDTLHIVVFSGTTRTIVIDDIDPDTGTKAPPVVVTDTTDDLLPDFLPVEWRGSNLVLVLGDSVVQLDTYKGSITRRWP